MSSGRLSPAIRAAGESRPPRVLAYSATPLTAEGIVELLPPAWRSRVAVAGERSALDDDASFDAAIIDLDTEGALDAVAAARAGGASAILLLASVSAPLDAEACEAADAILLRDEVEARTLRMALAAGSLGLRVTPRALPFGGPPRPAQADAAPSFALGEPAQRALELLADGMRDAEIALELNLSESATRKLIQRAVRRTGARTRCQAVAAAVRGGDLG